MLSQGDDELPLIQKEGSRFNSCILRGKKVVFAISSVVNDRSFSVGTFLALFLKPIIYLSFKSSTSLKIDTCFYSEGLLIRSIALVVYFTNTL
jgi:hypothetical protein